MIVCPFCVHENIDGVDFCEACGHSLVDHRVPRPATDVERALLKDAIGVLKMRKPIATSPRTPVREVLRAMIAQGTGCLLVVDDGGKLVGIFSERDALVKLNTRSTELGDHPVSAFMTRNPQVLELDDKLAFAVQRMDLGGYRHVPIVTSDGSPVGVVSVRDILRYLTDKLPH